MEKTLKKKKVLISSDYSRLKTGFGRNCKTVMKYLYQTGKYELIEYACGPFEYDDPALKAVPWKAYGAIPPDKFLKEEMEQNEVIGVAVKYGSYYIDDIIEKEQPDFFIGINDFWGFKDFYDKSWWNKVNSALWTTVDSLPLYEDLVHNGHKVKNLWVWSKFAENELKRLGFNQAQTLHGAFEVNDFRPLPNREELRAKAGLAPDDFVVGFVFRNQVRKLVGTLLEGFSLHKRRFPTTKAKILLHTSWSEGWEIARFIKEFDIDKKDILTSHVCKACKNYTIKPYEGERRPCGHCGNPETLITPKSYFGVEEAEMNEIYNLMDFYIHPVTSGGLEMPNVEALLAGVPIATCNYSCGEEFCEQGFVTKIKHSIYREFGSQFMKSQPCPSSIAKEIGDMEVVRNYMPKVYAEMSQQGVEWAREQFDHVTICKRIEEWIDNAPEVDHKSYTIRKQTHNDSYPLNESIEDPTEWAIDLVRGVFGYEESDKSPTVQKMAKKIKDGGSRREIWAKAVGMAKSVNHAKKKSAVEEFFPDDSMTDNAVFLAPVDFTKKLSLIQHVTDLCISPNRVYIVGDDVDREVYSQCGKIKMIPRTERSTNPEWLRGFKNSKGVKRFRQVSWEQNNNLVIISNET